MNQRHRSGKDKSREERRQRGQKTASTQLSLAIISVCPASLLVAGTKDPEGLFIQPNVEDLTGGQYVGKDK